MGKKDFGEALLKDGKVVEPKSVCFANAWIEGFSASASCLRRRLSIIRGVLQKKFSPIDISAF